jgi:hypothetical protein
MSVRRVRVIPGILKDGKWGGEEAFNVLMEQFRQRGDVAVEWHQSSAAATFAYHMLTAVVTYWENGA